MRVSQTSKWRLRLIPVALTVLTLLLSACGGNASTSTTATAGPVQIGNAGTLIPGTLKWGSDYTGGMPYIVQGDANNHVPFYGFEVDIAAHFGQLMQVSPQQVQVTYSNWPQGLASQQYDMFMNGLEIAKENIASATFSIPYYVYTQSIVVLSTNTSINTFDDLAGKKVETGTAYKAQFIMEDYNASHPSNKITISTSDNPTPFNDLLAGRVDAMFIDTPIAKWYGSNDPSGKFKTVGGDLNPGYYGIGFSKTNPNAATLKKEVNEAIAQSWRDGTLEHIYKDGGANNVNSNTNQAVFQKYDLWNNSEACIGNFLPENPTHVANCPHLLPS